MFNIKFNVLTQHVDEALQNFPKTLKDNGFTIINLREPDIVNDYSNQKVGGVYVWHCVGSVFNYFKFKQKGPYKIMFHEGLKLYIKDWAL